jgi:competence ComEA-like helix-hairpin-helix protein
MVGGTYYKNERASQNIEGDWCSQTRNCGVAPSLTSLDAPNLFELRDYPQVNRLRAGLNGTLDYLLANNSKLFVRSTFNRFSDDEVRARARFRFRGGGGSRWTQVSPDSGITTGSQFDRDIRLREVIQDIFTAQVGGEHFAKDGKSLDWAVGTSRASGMREGAATASARSLSRIQGIGDGTARAIVEQRERAGPYRTVDDLDDVAGIGPKTLERLRAVVEVR